MSDDRKLSHYYDRYAKQTLEDERYDIYEKQSEKLRDMLKSRLKERMKKKTGGEIRGVHIGIGCQGGPKGTIPFPLFPGLMGGTVWR